jgi:hypothetical protein
MPRLNGGYNPKAPPMFWDVRTTSLEPRAQSLAPTGHQKFIPIPMSTRRGLTANVGCW